VPLCRRDFLRLLAAGALVDAAAGCRDRAGMMQRRVDFPGTIRGEDHTACHRLVAGRPPLAPEGPVEADAPLRDVVIIGAGLSGLAAAWALHRAGVDDLLVLERADDIGGVSRGGHLRGHPCPWGAHYVGLPDPDSPVIMNLLSAVGVITDFTRDHRPIIDPRYRIHKPEVNLYHGRSHSRGFYPWDLATPADLSEFHAFRRHMYCWSRWRDVQGRPAFQLPVAYATQAEEVLRLDRITMARYLDDEGFTSPLLRGYVDNRLTDEYGCLASEISAYAALLFWAGTGGETAAPGSRPTHSRALAWPEGNMFLARRLAGLLPSGSIHTDAWVVAVRNHGDEVHVVEMDPRTGETRVHRARACVFAAPKLRADLLIPELDTAGRREHEGLEYTPWLVANLLLDECPEHDAKSLAWDNLVHGSWSLGFVNNQHFATPGQDSEQSFGLTFYASFSGQRRNATRRDLLELDWTTWAQLITDELEYILPDARRHIEQLDVWRWGHGMVRPAPGLIWGGTRDALCQPLGHIHFAGNDAGVLPLYEEAVHRGVAAAEEVLTRLGRIYTSLIEPTRERLD
jgi:phytoene dehydrogenase-like protein